MPDSILSDDGFWELHEGEWVATEKQKIALAEGAKPHNYAPVISDDGYWELIDGQWSPTEKQTIALQNGAIAHVVNTSNMTYYYANVAKQKNTTLLYVFGGFFVVLFASMILIIASISLNIISLMMGFGLINEFINPLILFIIGTIILIYGILNLLFRK